MVEDVEEVERAVCLEEGEFETRRLEKHLQLALKSLKLLHSYKSAPGTLVFN